MAKYRHSILLHNSTEQEIALYLEPWGEHIPMPANASLRIIGESEIEGEFEVEYGDQFIAVYGWTGSLLFVFQNEKEIL